MTERELLKRIKILLECMPMEPLQKQADKIIGKIIEILAQPEHIEDKLAMVERKQPLSELININKEWHQIGYEKAKTELKREPLSDEDIFAIGYKAGFAIDSIERDLALDYGFLDEDGDVDNEPYFKLVRAIEKAHGIGESNES